MWRDPPNTMAPHLLPPWVAIFRHYLQMQPETVVDSALEHKWKDWHNVHGIVWHTADGYPWFCVSCWASLSSLHCVWDHLCSKKHCGKRLAGQAAAELFDAMHWADWDWQAAGATEAPPRIGGLTPLPLAAAFGNLGLPRLPPAPSMGFASWPMPPGLPPPAPSAGFASWPVPPGLPPPTGRGATAHSAGGGEVDEQPRARRWKEERMAKALETLARAQREAAAAITALRDGATCSLPLPPPPPPPPARHSTSKCSHRRCRKSYSRRRYYSPDSMDDESTTRDGSMSSSRSSRTSAASEWGPVARRTRHGY